MRVVHVISGLTIGGAETVLYRLTTFPSDVEHEVICLERRGAFSDRLEAKGIKVHHLDWTVAAASPLSWMRLRKLIKKSGADVVQAWMYRSNILAGLAARSLGIPVIWNIRGSSVAPLRPATRFLARLGGILATSVPARIINCSAASVDLHAKLGYDPRQVVVVANGYDPADFQPDEEARKATRDALGADDKLFLIGSVGRWEPEKGYGLLLPAISRLREKGIPVRLLLVGQGLDRNNAALAALIERSGCRDAVEPMGQVQDVSAIARALDLHALASLTEGFPNVVAETMLTGTPNVVTDVGDARIIVGQTGWVVAPGSVEQLASAMEHAHAEWFSSPHSWSKRREAAAGMISESFSLGRMVSGYEDVWKEAALSASPQVELGSARRLRVLHVINSLTLGGAEALLYRVATRDTGNDHIVVSLGRPAWYSARLEEAGVELHHLGIDDFRDLPRGVARLNRLIRESSADVVHCWMYRSNVLAGLLAKTARKPVIWGIHSASLEPLRPSSRAVARLGGAIARWTPDFIINCSRRSEELHRAIGYSAAEGAVIPNGYDASRWFPDEKKRLEARRELGVGDEDFVVGAVSRWDPLKDIPNLLAAIRIAHDRGARLRCFLIGAGLDSANGELTAEIARARCEELVVPLGARGDVPDLARALDLHLLASCTEAFPNVVAETMLSGTPNVATDVGDAAIMVSEGGWIVPPQNPERLGEAIVEAYREWKELRGEWDERRQAARERIARNFSFERMLEAYDQVWKKVARQSRLNPTAVQ